jgi:hypothetical protein
MYCEYGINLTPLEYDLLRLFYLRYGDIGFPSPDKIFVEKREVSTAGRYTYLDHADSIDAADGSIGLGEFSQFQMLGLEAGASFQVEVKGRKLLYLDIIVNGDEGWDGVERDWIVCDPETGSF